MPNDSLGQLVATCLYNWKLLILDKDWNKAREEAQSVIDKCKCILKDIKPGEAPSMRSSALIYGILCRSLQDFTDLSETAASPNLAENHDLIEKAWTKMCDCKQRLEYAAKCCSNNDVIKWTFDQIENYEKAFQSDFGDGLYCSAEILIKKDYCNICGRDFRSCEHVSGLIYDGMRCSAVPQDIEFKSVSFVENPADPRCRVWPWNVEEDGIIHGYVLTVFSLDDFLYK